MKKADCSICSKKDLALNDTIKVDGKVYCSNCFDIHFSDPDVLQYKVVEREVDPTVCFSCNRGFGEVELNKISIYSVCPECEAIIKNKTFPTWVKAFFIGILVIVVSSFIWNWRFYTAYQDIGNSNKYFEAGDYSNAALLMKSASRKVPELEDLKTISAYFSGIDLLARDKSSDALKEFEKCIDKVPPDYDIDNLILQAKIGSDFDNKDYDGFLQASKELLALDTTAVGSITSVASAYACLYADKGQEEDKKSAFEYLDKAKQIDSTSEEMLAYYNMIEYRIDSRKIIKREEFIKQFPKGWTKN